MHQFRTLVLFSAVLALPAWGCEEDILAESLELGTLTPATISAWTVPYLRALQKRLGREIPVAVGLNGHSFRELNRLLDLFLTSEQALQIPADDGPLAAAGLRRRIAPSEMWEEDLDVSKSSGLPRRYPVTKSRDYLVVSNFQGLEFILYWMKFGGLTSRFPGWGIYKIRFEFIDPSSPEGAPLIVDWIPCFATKDQEQPLVWITGNGPGTSYIDPLEMTSDFAHGEPTMHHFLFYPYLFASLKKLSAEGLDFALASYPSEDERDRSLIAENLLKRLGNVVDPFDRNGHFWRKKGEPSPIARRAVAALKFFSENGLVLAPAGLIPPEEKTAITEKIRSNGYRSRQVAAGYVESILSHSGPMTKARFQSTYSGTRADDWTFFKKLSVLDARGRFADGYVAEVLATEGIEEERVVADWQGEDWESFDLIRAVGFMRKGGYTFDEATGAWRKLVP